MREGEQDTRQRLRVWSDGSRAQLIIAFTVVVREQESLQYRARSDECSGMTTFQAYVRTFLNLCWACHL